MLLNDTSLLTDQTIKKLNELNIRHINTGEDKLTEETALKFIDWFTNSTFIQELHRKEA